MESTWLKQLWRTFVLFWNVEIFIYFFKNKPEVLYLLPFWEFFIKKLKCVHTCTWGWVIYSSSKEWQFSPNCPRFEPWVCANSFPTWGAFFPCMRALTRILLVPLADLPKRKKVIASSQMDVKSTPPNQDWSKLETKIFSACLASF